MNLSTLEMTRKDVHSPEYQNTKESYLKLIYQPKLPIFQSFDLFLQNVNLCQAQLACPFTAGNNFQASRLFWTIPKVNTGYRGASVEGTIHNPSCFLVYNLKLVYLCSVKTLSSAECCFASLRAVSFSCRSLEEVSKLLCCSSI